MLKIGDIVTRNSHNNDILFKIEDIDNDNILLIGVNIRLTADALIDDLKKCDKDEDIENEREFINKIKNLNDLDRNNYFYLPGKILHIDADNSYLKRCLKFYKDNNIYAIGKLEDEENISLYIKDWIKEYNPNIIVITGHDALINNSITGEKDYKNSKYFINAVKSAREVEMNHEKLLIIAGACQSNYEELIKAGASYASSPKRINIHALDPAIIASTLALTDSKKEIDIKNVLEKTKYGCNGIGGIITNGTMYIGYPR